ncbi:hypothetical protein GOARA_036_01580 [Gordonia araii NBRC 100433]|uniref:Lipoprotein LpqH n=1 Tax=Gordonia araii NBRC 100433 TaxID=1073574 RepID=G7H0Q1_9ACTN|nr:lipoprotein LpqH [Gordonia araii]NNG96811.1 lipoprotein LpqH [Gordonia araii NBRC 100433]GAB09426.1 hypothetical protein GOARA_036_01580 [Gordonia araii NBRC 100433]
MRRTQIAAVLGAGAIALLLPACSSVDNPIADGGDASIKVDGKELNLADKTVGCVTGDGRVNIGVGSEAGKSAIAAVVTEGDNPQVISVGLGAIDGVTLGFVQGIPGGGSATVKKVLKTYTITGEATGINMSNPLQPSKKSFEFKVRCP